MGLFDFFKPRKQKSAYDVLMENPLFRQQKEVYDAFNKLARAIGCDTDELPNGFGEFGLTPTNPIPTNTIMGSYAYLSQLCTADGIRVENRRRGSMNSEVSKMPIDIYELSSRDGILLATIYISPYHQRNSKNAPRGFRLIF
jgi:hypothetical protein